MGTRSLFATPLFEADLSGRVDLEELERTIHYLAEADGAGQAWCEEKQYWGYTSYASLDDLPQRDPAIGDLVPILEEEAARFAKELAWDHVPSLDSIWVNLMEPGGHHAAHIHPHAVLSGTLYIDVPEGSGAIRFEDPRLPMMMAAPLRDEDAPEALRTHVTVSPQAGTLLLWESFLRHEVLPHPGPDPRLSISFNFA